MRTKTVGGRRKHPRSATPPSVTTNKDEFGATEFETSHGGGDDDVGEVPMADCIGQHSNGSPLDVLNHESIDLLDKSICICCNKGGGVLVCSESGCPVVLHAKCICADPKFDDLGNFYCPYCWYKRAVNMSQDLKKRVLIAKKALSSFLDKDAVASDGLVWTDKAAKRKEPDAGDGISLGGDGRQGTDGVDIQPLQPKEDQPRKLRKEDGDECEIALEDQAESDGDFRSCGEEDVPVDINLVEDSVNRAKFDKPNRTETYEIRLLERKESFEAEDSTHNKEDVHERIVEVGEEEEPLTASHLGKRTDGHSPDLSFPKGTQESVAKSAEKGRKTDKRKMPHREQKVSATGSSVSETIESDSDVISGRKRHVKRKVQKTAYPQIGSARKSLLQEQNTKGENASGINEEVTSSRLRRRSQSLPKQVKNQNSLTIRRNKLLWTAEEEKALEEGVLRFSTENQHIPWRRILDFGSHVFDKTRTPVDLKDKWRNITSKKGHK